MIREIRKKMLILSNRAPFDEDIRAYIRDIEKNEWLYNNMRLEGSALTKEQLAVISKGEFVLSVPVEEHLLADRLLKSLERLWNFVDMKRDLDLSILDEINAIICGRKEKMAYRKRNGVVPELDYIPPIPAEIPGRMNNFGAMLAKASYADGGHDECFEYAARIHNEIIRIFPFGLKDKLTARAAAAFYLMTKGYPAISPSMREEEYNKMAAEYLQNGDCKPYARVLKEEVLRRMELMIRLTAY